MRLSALLCTLCSVLIIHGVSKVKSQTVNEYDGHMPASFPESSSSSTFYALQSCHQILQGDSGEFYSPDYLCSHPPLWCNWTVQVRRGMRARLYLEDLTPEGACRRKTDQVHLDEGPGSGGGSRVLERCWRSAEYTAASNVVHVVQLVSPNPEPPHRGFYGAYQALGDPDPPATRSADHVQREEQDEDESKPEEPDTLPVQPSEFPPPTEAPGHAHHSSALPTEAWGESSAEIRKTRAKSGNLESSALPARSVGDASTVGPGAAARLWSSSTRAPDEPTTAGVKIGRASQAGVELHDGSSPGNGTKAAKRRKPSNKTKNKLSPVLNHRPLNSNPVTFTRPVRVTSTPPPSSTKLGPVPMWTSTVTVEVRRTPDDPTSPRVTPNSCTGTSQAGTEEGDWSPAGKGTNATERREREKISQVRNTRRPPEPLHRSGAVLLEVTVEVRPTGGEERDWDDVKHLYAAAVETMISKSAENLDLKSVTSKISKRLSDGALFIFWVQFGEDATDGPAYRALRSNLLQLRGRSLDAPGHIVVLSISIEDIDECRSGSSSCPCLHGYSPGPGEAVCAIPQSDECGSRAWLLLWVLCFLLCLLIALILAAMLLLYRRYHRGSFSTTDVNNNRERRERACARPTPPAPPLHLLRFSPLTPPKGSEGKTQPEHDRI